MDKLYTLTAQRKHVHKNIGHKSTNVPFSYKDL